MTGTEYAILLALVQGVPAVAQALQVAAMQNDLTPEQFAALQVARDASIAAYLKATGQG